MKQQSKSVEISVIVDTERSKHLASQMGASEQQPFKVGIIGCGQLGTMILTKLIET